MFFTRARVIRWVILLILGVVAIVVCWHDPVYAGSSAAAVTVHTDGYGAFLPLAAPADGSIVDAPAPSVRLAEIDTPAAGHASVTALLIGAGLVALLFTAVTLATFRRR